MTQNVTNYLIIIDFQEFVSLSFSLYWEYFMIVSKSICELKRYLRKFEFSTVNSHFVGINIQVSPQIYLHLST